MVPLPKIERRGNWQNPDLQRFCFPRQCIWVPQCGSFGFLCPHMCSLPDPTSRVGLFYCPYGRQAGSSEGAAAFFDHKV